MSRVIENDHPWTEDEVEYHLARGRFDDVEQNKQQFPPGSAQPITEEDSPGLELDKDIFEYVKNLGTEEVKSDLLKADLHPQGNDNEMRVALAQHLQEVRDASTNT